MAREYSFNDLAGCVTQRRSRETGLSAGLYPAQQAGLDAGAGQWATVCEPHGCIRNHATLARARHHLADLNGWCEACANAAANA
jgi:hypothetical protein